MEKYQIEGRNPVYEALRSKVKITKIFVEENKQNNERVKKIIKLAKDKNVPIVIREFLKNFAETERHQGVVAIAIKDKLKLKDIKDPQLVIIISGSDYDMNLGTLIRSAEAAGANCIIVPRKTKISPLVIKSSAGAISHIPVIEENLFTALKHFRKIGLIVYGLDEEAKTTIYNANLNQPIVLVIGKEDSGLNESSSKYIDEYLKIPMYGKMNSLNMAVSASIAMFETIRQKK